MADSIAHRLRSSDPEDVYDAIIDIGKQSRGELADLVTPYLTSPTGFLRDAALRTLTFYLGLPEHKATALHALEDDADSEVREAAAMGLGRFASRDHAVLARLVRVAVNRDEEERVRAAAFLAALVAAGVERAEFPRAAVVPGFDRRADWVLLARTLERAGVAVRLASRLIPLGWRKWGSRPFPTGWSGWALIGCTRCVSSCVGFLMAMSGRWPRRSDWLVRSLTRPATSRCWRRLRRSPTMSSYRAGRAFSAT